ncbi:MAG TPA: hypothetical protein VFR97_09720 [Capillimicrobium sp.]|nr:hypothetical protein [Capillimicrobium sp.]
MRRSTMVAAAAVLVLAGCGGDGERPGAAPATAPPATTAPRGAADERLFDRAAALVVGTAALQQDAEAYHELAARHGFDHGAMLARDGAEARRLVRRMRATHRDLDATYGEIAAVVARTPALARHDVVLASGTGRDRPRTAVPFSLQTPAGRRYAQPGSFFAITRGALWGTDPRFTAPGGERMPDADFLVTAAREFHTAAQQLATAAELGPPAG